MIYVNNNGVWKKVKNFHTFQSGGQLTVKSAFVNHNGVWKKVYSKDGGVTPPNEILEQIEFDYFAGGGFMGLLDEMSTQYQSYSAGTDLNPGYDSNSVIFGGQFQVTDFGTGDTYLNANRPYSALYSSPRPIFTKDSQWLELNGVEISNVDLLNTSIDLSIYDSMPQQTFVTYMQNVIDNLRFEVRYMPNSNGKKIDPVVAIVSEEQTIKLTCNPFDFDINRPIPETEPNHSRSVGVFEDYDRSIIPVAVGRAERIALGELDHYVPISNCIDMVAWGFLINIDVAVTFKHIASGETKTITETLSLNINGNF